MRNESTELRFTKSWMTHYSAVFNCHNPFFLMGLRSKLLPSDHYLMTVAKAASVQHPCPELADVSIRRNQLWSVFLLLI